MRRVLLLIILSAALFFPFQAIHENRDINPPEQALHQDVASYQIEVSLDPQGKTLSGRETITYANHTGRPIPDLVFHLYLNAFRDENSTFLQESRGVGRGQVFDSQHNGWIEISRLRIKDGPALKIEPLGDGTLARAGLPQPVQDGEEIVLEAEFSAQLPRVVARSGWAEDAAGEPFFFAAQWFPKLGVWEDGAWNAYPYHADSEFYADFGDYQVTITVPAGFKVAGSGTPGDVRINPDGMQTIQYLAPDVIDFAWMASRNLQTAVRSVGKTEVVYSYLPEHAWSVKTALDAAELALRRYTEWYGAYPYPRLTVVDVPEAGIGMGGMEYPTLVAAGAGKSPERGGFFGGGARGLKMLIYHEVAHQWWQSLVATNEAEAPWLDEGLADYSTARLVLEQDGIDREKFTQGSYGNDYLDRRRPEFLRQPGLAMLQNAWDFSREEYVIGAYAKPTLALLTLESVLSSETMLRALHAYFERFAFAHPTSADFRAVIEEFSSEDVGWFFDGLVTGNETLNYLVKDLKPNTVTLAREGLAIPVGVEIVFDGGEREELTWDAQPAEETLTFAGKPTIQSVMIDPQHTRYIELLWKDNQAESQVQAAREPANPTPGAVQVASYAIDVRLDETARQLKGQEQITYRNTTNKPIPDLVFHLYLNAFKNESTIFMKEAGPEHRGFGYDPRYPGWIEVNQVRLAGGEELNLRVESDGTLARAGLPVAVQPGETVRVMVEFTAQLPRVFARTGWALDRKGEPFFMVGQWFPKLGVWQDSGWNAYPLHANSEFFADFGRYDVQITLPERYHSGATGVEVENVSHADGTRTVVYHAERVIDFAWTASPNFQSRTARAGAVEITYLFLPEHAWSADRALDIAVQSIQHYTEWFGPYAYPRLTLVDPPDSGQGAGGMEYPTLVTVGTLDFTGLGSLYAGSGWERTLEMVAAHEIAHQWWQSMVATNEAEEPWLDEGFADYSTVRLMQAVYGQKGGLVDFGGLHASYLDFRRGEYLSMPETAIAGKAWDFGPVEYGIASYSKPAAALLTLQNILGVEKMNTLMQAYFERWRFGHPTARDFQALAVETTGRPLDWFFGDPGNKSGLVNGSGTLNYSAQAIGADWLTVRREGSLVIMVDILVTYNDGRQEYLTWDGQAVEKKFQLEKPLRSFYIDPQHKLVVELVWADNGLANQPDWTAWLSAAGRLVYRLQDCLLVLGGL
jgi:aminopeptidase N